MDTYRQDQLENMEKTHNIDFPMCIKISGTGQSTKYMDITYEEYRAIKLILVNKKGQTND